MKARPTTAQPMTPRSKREARAGLGLFLFLVLAFAACFMWKGAALERVVGARAVTIYMWSVAAASIIARLSLREPLGDVSFRWHGWLTSRAMLVAFAMPLLVGLVSFGLGWALGLASFAPAQLPETIFHFAISGPGAARFWKYLLVSATVGGLWSCKAAAGEEIGWRGYMLTRLIESGARAPLFLSGLIWALWHLPLIFTGQYAGVARTPGSIALFAADIVGLGFIFAWLRLSSGSIWPCILAHGVWNATVFGTFRETTRGGAAWVGEPGALTAIVVILFALALYWLWPIPQEA
jgi:membrane protease YdiL (CAAX protease family)